MAEIWLTEEERQERVAHLERLKTSRRQEIAEMLKVARGFGDLSENAEYDAAKNEQARNEYEILRLEDELRNAKIFDHRAVDTSMVSMGSTVSFRDVVRGKTLSYTIVGTAAASPAKGSISNESPIGAALLGHKVGEIVSADTPSGVRQFEILTIGK
ncbi:MAG TPA: transcription elongation factor GreA [Eubacteriales bacterium]|jgi:transcription elongation factor GreA|nr:transcription elongation factor GreA [Clostridia bacterium]HRV73871.1 transcription elongation factor GreA [Eubacteriales bacterium]